MKELVQLLRAAKNFCFNVAFLPLQVIPIKSFEPIIVEFNLESSDKEITKRIVSLIPCEANAYEIGESHSSQKNEQEKFYPIIPYLIDKKTYAWGIRAKRLELHCD